MRRGTGMKWPGLQFLALLAACLGAGLAHAGEVEANPAARLRAEYAELQDRLRGNPFQRPLYLDSSETPGGVAGSVYALLDHPFATTALALNKPGRWCDILMLHLNTKYCRASITGRDGSLQVNIGKKHDQPLSQSYRVNFVYRVVAQIPDYLKVMLAAEEGPLSTYDYAIGFEATPLEAGRTLVRLRYSYAYGFPGRLAMQAYLGTVGSDKVGFTVTGRHPDGRLAYIGGMRGLVERNTMRYYLAIEAILGALSLPPQEQLEKSLRDWFAAVEHYPRQLHELDLAEYLDMKHRENLRILRGDD